MKHGFMKKIDGRTEMVWKWKDFKCVLQVIKRILEHIDCERPTGHPMLFGIVATGLGGVVGKKSAGDGGVSVQKYIYLLTRAL